MPRPEILNTTAKRADPVNDEIRRGSNSSRGQRNLQSTVSSDYRSSDYRLSFGREKRDQGNATANPSGNIQRHATNSLQPSSSLPPKNKPLHLPVQARV